jgi:lipopolysaccharide heptosyltransferase I
MSPNLDKINAKRVALIKPSALGDIVHALPVLSALRVRFPRAHITWIVNEAYEPLLEGHPDLDATLAFDRNGGASDFVRFLGRIRRQRFDLVIDLQGLLRSGLMAWLSGARRRIGLFSAREGARWAYTDVLAALGGKGQGDFHAVDRYWLVAEALGVGNLPKQFVVPIQERDRTWTLDRLSGWQRPWLMMNLGTRWETKRWPVRHFVELARRSTAKVGGSIILVGSEGEARLAGAFVQELPQQTLNLTGATTLGQLAAVLEQAELMVSNDSGPLHLAAALGRPVVAPFTCTSPVRTGPYGQAGGAVATRLWCAASYLKTCSRMECMTELTPDRLWPVLEHHLKTWQRRSA